MTMQQVDVSLGIIGILLSGTAVAVLLALRSSLGAYTERIERSNTVTRQSNESLRQEIDRWRAGNDATLNALHRMRETIIKERSA